MSLCRARRLRDKDDSCDADAAEEDTADTDAVEGESADADVCAEKDAVETGGDGEACVPVLISGGGRLCRWRRGGGEQLR